MPVDDLLVWAAETSRHREGRPGVDVSSAKENKPEPPAEYHSVVGRPRSPRPMKWYGKMASSSSLHVPLAPFVYCRKAGTCTAFSLSTSAQTVSHLTFSTDTGHCAAACSGRCSLHAAKKDDEDVAVNGNDLLPNVTEPLRPRKRHHRRSNSNSSSASTEDLHSRLERARQELRLGNVHIARAIVAEEMEKLNRREEK